MHRRAFLTAALAAPWVRAAELLPAAKGQRAVVVGGGWGGLSAARHLKEAAPELEVVLVERNPAFTSLPLSNRWLGGLVDGALLTHDYGAAAQAFGYSFIQSEVTAIDRDHRRIHTPAGALAYDWLVLAVGIRHDYAAWFGDNADATAHASKHFAPAWTAGGGVAALKAKLDAFPGGDLVMTVPPAPYRCPPAPYERAVIIASLMKSRGIKGRLHLLDPNPVMLGYDRVFRESYRDWIDYLPQATVKSVDPFRKVVTTDFDTLPFDDAILMPPQAAGELVRQAGLEAPGGWAAQDPVRLQALADERIWLVGDLIDKASPLFGHYPKTGQIAARLGHIAALEIAARSRGQEAARRLPDSTCHVIARTEPLETMRVDTRYDFRGDGLIRQTVKQTYNAQPRDEDLAWAREMFAQLLAPAGD